MTDYGTISANSNYYFRFPLITNPSAADMPFTYKIRLLRYEPSTFYPTVIGEYEMKNLEQVLTGSSGNIVVRLNSGNKIVQSTMTLELSLQNSDNTVSYYPSLGHQILVKFENDNIKAFTSLAGLTNLA